MTDRKLGAVERALLILKCFDTGRTALSLTDLATETGFYKSTVLRLTETLEAFDYLVRDGEKVYRLGPAAGQLGAVYHSTYSLEAELMPYLQRLADETGETSAYFVLRDEMRVCLLRVNSDNPIRLHLDEGQELPITGGAGSRVLRAFRGDDWGDAERVRARGWAITAGEREPEVASVAVALHGVSGNFYGILTVSGPIHRYGEAEREKALAMMLDMAAALKARLP